MKEVIGWRCDEEGRSRRGQMHSFSPPGFSAATLNKLTLFK